MDAQTHKFNLLSSGKINSYSERFSSAFSCPEDVESIIRLISLSKARIARFCS